MIIEFVSYTLIFQWTVDSYFVLYLWAIGNMQSRRHLRCRSINRRRARERVLLVAGLRELRIVPSRQSSIHRLLLDQVYIRPRRPLASHRDAKVLAKVIVFAKQRAEACRHFAACASAYTIHANFLFFPLLMQPTLRLVERESSRHLNALLQTVVFGSSQSVVLCSTLSLSL